MDIKKIQELCDEKLLRWTNHIFVRLVQRNISMQDVINAIMSGEIIENYPDKTKWSDDFKTRKES